MTIETTTTPSSHVNLIGKNFSRFNALTELGGTDEQKQLYLDGLSSLTNDFRTLPPNKFDPVARRRRLGRCTLDPVTRTLSWHPPEKLDEQDNGLASVDVGELNPEYKGALRYFPAIKPHSHENPLFTSLIWLDFEKIDWTAEDLCKTHRIAIEFQRMVPQGGEWIAGAPNMFHQDGETATFCHLIGRMNLVGGENAVGTLDRIGTRPDDEGYPPESVLARFTLMEPLDSWCGLDQEIVHYVALTIRVRRLREIC